MRAFKKPVFSVVASCMAGAMVLTGCGKSDPEPTNTQPTSKEAVSEMTQEYITDSFNFSSRAMSNSQQAGIEAVKVVGVKNADALTQSTDSLKKFNKLSNDQVAKVGAIYSSYDPLKSYFDYSGTNEKEKAILHMWTLATTSLYGSEKKEILEVSVPEDSIEVSGNSAEVDLKKVRYTTNEAEDKKLPISSSGAPSNLYLTEKGEGEWKIDGKKTYNELKPVKELKKSQVNSSPSTATKKPSSKPTGSPKASKSAKPSPSKSSSKG